DGGAVGTLHVVRVNLKLGLGVHLRIVGEQEIAIGLLGVRLLRVLVDDNAAVEDAVGVLVQNAIVELPAAAMRAGVFDEHVIIKVLPAGADEESIDQAFAALARKDGMDIIADDCAT